MLSEVPNPKVSICNGMRPISFPSYLFLERLLLEVNEDNGNRTCSLLSFEPIRNVVIIRANLIGLFYSKLR